MRIEQRVQERRKVARVVEALSAGAKGYLLKDAQRDELLECIRSVHAGDTRIPPSLLARLGPDPRR